MRNDVNMRLSGNSCLYVYIQWKTEIVEQTQKKAHLKNCMQVCNYVKNIIMRAGHFKKPLILQNDQILIILIISTRGI